ncbi:hypothetical protein MLD38_025709 [Melastoma candidum]|uniref:Uncharacterized protein n=1 Tax=Melastoma candidum TaxID=119954 RepID=A0ACB9NWA5_9MYRT|nr:hypothetical protein MLD38_025709 [Melastoma candidum]
MDRTGLSFRWFADGRPSLEGFDFDFMFRSSVDASDDESLIELDLGYPPSKGIRVISIPKELEFSFPPLGSANPVAHDDELFSGPRVWPYYFDPPRRHTAGHEPFYNFTPPGYKKPHRALEIYESRSSSMRDWKPCKRIIKGCLKFLMPTFGCLGRGSSSSKGKFNKPQELSSIISRGELFLKS